MIVYGNTNSNIKIIILKALARISWRWWWRWSWMPIPKFQTLWSLCKMRQWFRKTSPIIQCNMMVAYGAFDCLSSLFKRSICNHLRHIIGVVDVRGKEEIVYQGCYQIVRPCVEHNWLGNATNMPIRIIQLDDFDPIV